MEANNNNINIPPDELTQVYFSDRRIQQTLRTIRNINSSVALPSLFLLIPILITLTESDPDWMVLLCLGIVPFDILCQTSAIISVRTIKTSSVKLLKSLVYWILACTILGGIGLIFISALIILTIKPSCSRVTCVSDVICSILLALITAFGVAYNLIHWQVLKESVWENPVLRERGSQIMLVDLSTPEDNELPVTSVSESLDPSAGFFYLRMEEEEEEEPSSTVFPQ